MLYILRIRLEQIGTSECTIGRRIENSRRRSSRHFRGERRGEERLTVRDENVIGECAILTEAEAENAVQLIVQRQQHEEEEMGREKRKNKSTHSNRRRDTEGSR